MSITPNDYVKVKLTDYGRQVLRERRQQLRDRLQKASHLLAGDGVPYEDEDGWSRWQLWHLMQTFGECGAGSPIPFDDFTIEEVAVSDPQDSPR